MSWGEELAKAVKDLKKAWDDLLVAMGAERLLKVLDRFAKRCGL